MSRPASPIVVSLTIKRRQFRVLIREHGPFAWVATIGRPTGRLGSTGSLGTTVATSAEAALRRAIDEIILMVAPLGTEPEEPQEERPAEGAMISMSRHPTTPCCRRPAGASG